jgi:hypothetical protein
MVTGGAPRGFGALQDVGGDAGDSHTDDRSLRLEQRIVDLGNDGYKEVLVTRLDGQSLPSDG